MLKSWNSAGSACREGFFEEKGMARARVEAVGLKSELFVGVPCDGIALEHFEREFARTAPSRFVFDGGQKVSCEAPATEAGQDREVVNVDELLAGKGGKALEAVAQSGKLALDMQQQAERMRQLGQPRGQVFPRVCGQSLTAAHRIERVVVQRLHQLSGVDGIAVIDRGNREGR